MNSVLRNLITLALTLAISTGAAVVVKGLLRAAQRAGQAKAASRYHARVADYDRGRWSSVPDAPVILFYKPEPARTEAAIRNGTTGTVKLSMLLNRNGTVTNITPVESLPDGLTEAAIEAARNISFRPAVLGGRYVNTEQLVEFNFDGRDFESRSMVTRPVARGRK
jgi:TonB family protein